MRFDFPKHETRCPSQVGRYADDDAVTQTFVCADLASFSATTERLGDRRMLEVMRRIAKLVRYQIEHFGGRELELRGDCFLLAFTSALAGVRCAIGIQRALKAGNEGHPGEDLEIRIAVHTGDVLRDGDHFFGQSLIVAFRLLEIAGAGEILLSSATQRRVSGHWIGRSATERAFLPKGLRSEIHFAAAEWRHGTDSLSSLESTTGVAGGPARWESVGLAAG